MYTKGYFKNKKITVMSLGLLGRAVGDAVFLAEEGADLIVTDLKTEEELQASVNRLKGFSNVTFRLGEHKLEDFRDRDFILKGAGIPLQNEFIAEAEKNGIPIEMSTSLFCALSPAHHIGITGTRGKSTVTQFIFEALESMEKTAYLGGNVRGVSTLAMLPDVTADDYVVLELDSWQLQGFGTRKISPEVCVFTSIFRDHMNYYKENMDAYITDKANIFLNQKPGDIYILGEQAEPEIKRLFPEALENAHVVDFSENVKRWNLKLVGEHNLYNASLAFEALRLMGFKTDDMKEAFEAMEPVEGRLEFVREVHGAKIYNDNNATTPDATIAGLKALAEKKPLILIMGGTDKGLPLEALIESVSKYARKAILLPGNGTDRFIAEGAREKGVKYFLAHSVKDAVSEALAINQDDDVILFSPAFSSFGQYNNEYERNDDFKNTVEQIKE